MPLLPPLRLPAAPFTVAAATWLLTACTTYGPAQFPPGTPATAVREKMGVPTGTYPLPDRGVRYEYARGPFGKHTYMVDFDANAKLTGATQVLTENNFTRIKDGMHRDQVLFEIGRPSDVRGLGWQKRVLWSYRYDAVFCLWYQVSFNQQWEVVETGYGPADSFDSGLRKTINWYVANESWWRGVMDGSYRDWVELHYTQGGRPS